MYSIGVSSIGERIDAELMRAYAGNGVEFMEISERSYEGFDYGAVKALAARFGVKLWSLHLPFGGELDLSSTDGMARGRALDALADIIARGADIGIDKFIIHPSYEPIGDGERPQRLDIACGSLSQLAEAGAKHGATLCVEDLPRSCLGNSASDMERLLGADGRLRACLDTNHIVHEKPDGLIRRLGARLVTLHVSDFDFVNERHWLPGEGDIDWNGVLAALKDAGYSGVWMYEVSFACPKTILRDRRLTCADFRRNASELFAGVRPTVFSRPKPNLGFWE